MNSINAKRPRQRGVALLIALTLLLFASIIALSAVRYSALAVRVANNNEYRISTFESVQSVIDAAISNPSNTPVSGATGYVACSTGVSGCNSDAATVTLPNNFLAADIAAQRVTVKIKRLAGTTNCPRAFGNELDFFCAQFSVESTYDHNAAGDGRGRSMVTEGVIVPYN